MKKTFKKGFTLIELTIVIAIIAILAGVMIPTYNVLMRNARQHLAYKQASAEYLHYRDKHVEYGTGEKLAKHVLINVNYEGDNYFFVAMDNAASVDDEPKLEDTLLFGSDDVNYIIGYSIEKDVSKRNNENQYYISGGDISADLPEQLDNVKMYELKLESDSTDDPDDPPDDPPVDPPTIIEGKKGDVIEFGSYPQSDVTDEMGNTLNKVINYSETMRPSEGEETYTTGNGYTWTSYKFYDNGVRANYAWYIDVECEGEKYRGMYFVKYRPCYSDRTAKNAKAEYPNSGWEWEYQDENGYSINTIYWFKYEPIKWIITEKEEGSNIYYTVMACNILDAQAYQTSLSRQNNRYTGIIVSKSGYNPSYPYVSEGSKSYVDYDIFIEQETRTGDGRAFANNWQSSEIKNWLGIRDSSGNLSGTFATTAFSVADRGLIQNTSLTKNGGWDYYKGDGSTSSTHGFISPTGCYYKKGSDNKYNRTGTFSTYEITYSDPNNYNNDVLGNKALENNYIWLPSYQEIYEDYAETNIYDQAPNAVAKPTGYAMAQGAYCQHWDTDPFTKESAREYKGNGTYWLRTSSGRNTSRINFVASNGVLGFTDVDKRINAISNCDEVNATYYGIRPMTRVEGK